MREGTRGWEGGLENKAPFSLLSLPVVEPAPTRGGSSGPMTPTAAMCLVFLCIDRVWWEGRGRGGR